MSRVLREEARAKKNVNKSWLASKGHRQGATAQKKARGEMNDEDEEEEKEDDETPNAGRRGLYYCCGCLENIRLSQVTRRIATRIATTTRKRR